MDIIKKIYFVEKTQKIEGSYIEVETLAVADNIEGAMAQFNELSESKEEYSGLIVNEYEFKAHESFFERLLNQFKSIPANFYRTVNILNYQSLAEVY